MNTNAMINRIKKIIISPATEWDKIKDEVTVNQDLILKYVLPLTILSGIATFIKYAFFGIKTPFLGTITFPIGTSIVQGIISTLAPILGVIIAAFIINMLAESFNSKKDLNRAFKLVVYSFTPALVAGIISSISFYLSWIVIFGLYGIYLLWIGIDKMMETPEDKKLIYIIVSILVIIVTVIIVSIILGTIFTFLGLSASAVSGIR